MMKKYSSARRRIVRKIEFYVIINHFWSKLIWINKSNDSIKSLDIKLTLAFCQVDFLRFIILCLERSHFLWCQINLVEITLSNTSISELPVRSILKNQSQVTRFKFQKLFVYYFLAESRVNQS